MSDSNRCSRSSCPYPPGAPPLVLGPGRRAEIYLGLADLYRPPTWEQVQGALEQVLLKYPRFLLDARDAHAQPAKELERHEQESYRLGLEAYQAEYVRLFVNSRQGVGAPPYASFYGEGILMGKAAQEALAFYGRFGMAPDAAGGDPPDHIGSELEFLGLLCSGEQKALAEANGSEAAELKQGQAEFLHGHLLRWANRFCDRLIDHTHLAYYRLIGIFTKGFLAHESLFLQGGPAEDVLRAEEKQEAPPVSKRGETR